MNTTPTKLPPHQAALDNLDAAWFARFEKLGLSVVMLRLDCRADTKAAGMASIEHTLGEELLRAGIGAFDSTFYPGTMDEGLAGIRWHFFHIQDLGKAVAFLKARLEVIGILANSAIFHVESPNRMVVWWHPQPELIGCATNEKDIPI